MNLGRKRKKTKKNYKTHLRPKIETGRNYQNLSFSAPKTKTKTNFGRSLYTVSHCECSSSLKRDVGLIFEWPLNTVRRKTMDYIDKWNVGSIRYSRLNELERKPSRILASMHVRIIAYSLRTVSGVFRGWALAPALPWDEEFFRCYCTYKRHHFTMNLFKTCARMHYCEAKL